MILCPVTPARWLQHCGLTISHQTPACSTAAVCSAAYTSVHQQIIGMAACSKHVNIVTKIRWAAIVKSINKIWHVVFYLHISKFINTYLHLPRPAQPAPGPLRTTVMTATSVSTTNTQAGARHAFIHFYTFLDILSKLSPTDKCHPGKIFEVGSSDADTQN